MNPLPVSAFKQLTPAQQTLYEMLADGFAHTREVLAESLGLEVELTEDKSKRYNALSVHLFYLRRKLRPHVLGIRTEREGEKILYRLVRLTN